MARRRFEHLVVELSVAVGALVPRYRLWLFLGERGWGPDALSRDEVVAFCRDGLDAFLAELGWSVSPRARRRLLRAVGRFDPRHPTPAEFMERLGSPSAS